MHKACVPPPLPWGGCSVFAGWYFRFNAFRCGRWRRASRLRLWLGLGRLSICHLSSSSRATFRSPRPLPSSVPHCRAPGPDDEAKMLAQDEREIGYTRYNIPLECMRSLGWQPLPQGVTVFQYVPNTELDDDHPARTRNPDGTPSPRASFPSREYPLPQTYVDVCILGCLEYSRQFATKWIEGFVGWPSADNPFWLNDRPYSRQPWLHEPRHKEIDDLLASVLPGAYACRSLPARFAEHYLCGAAARQPVDVTYTSYKARNREVARVAVRRPRHFVFEYRERIGAERWGAVAKAPEDMVLSLACRLGPEAGYRRSMCLRNSYGFTAPALMRDVGGARGVNGLLYVAPMAWLRDGEAPGPDADLFLGEGLERVELSPEHFEVLNNWMTIPPGATIYTYVAATPQPPSFDFPIRQSLIDTILGGCLQHSMGADFCAEWVDTTDGWALPDGRVYWLNDRHIGRRPWMALGGSYKIFDRLVYESTSPCVPEGVLLQRRLPEEYTMVQVSDG